MATNKPDIDWDAVEKEAVAREELTPEEFQKLIDMKAERKKRDTFNEFLEDRKLKAEKLFPGVSKWTVGYSGMLNTLEQFKEESDNSSNYPPHDIIAKHEYAEDDGPCKTTYQIVMALAGFTADDLEIWLGENTLHVEGSARDLDEFKPVIEGNKITQIYEHAGIAKRDFSRQFLVADNVRFVSAVLSGGVLTITLDYVNTHGSYEEFTVVNGDAK
jgi:molecular chaperone IbpA